MRFLTGVVILTGVLSLTGVMSRTGVRFLTGVLSLTGVRSHQVPCTAKRATICEAEVWQAIASVWTDRAAAGGGVEGAKDW